MHGKGLDKDMGAVNPDGLHCGMKETGRQRHTLQGWKPTEKYRLVRATSLSGPLG